MNPTLVILAAGMASRYGSMKQTQAFGPSGETIMDYSIYDAIEAGFIQDEIARSAYEYQRGIESGEKIIVGVNKFTVNKEVAVPPFKIDDSIRLIQTERLIKLRAERPAEIAANCLEKIRLAAIEGTNLMPPVIDAVENRCTLGEVADVLRGVFGEYK